VVFWLLQNYLRLKGYFIPLCSDRVNIHINMQNTNVIGYPINANAMDGQWLRYSRSVIVSNSCAIDHRYV